MVRQETRLSTFLFEGLRILFLRPPRLGDWIAGPRAVALLTLAGLLLSWAAQYVLTPGTPTFNPAALSTGWLGIVVLAFCCWMLADLRSPRPTPAALITVLLAASIWLVVLTVAGYGLARSVLPKQVAELAQWAVFAIAIAWGVVAQLVYWARAGVLQGGRGTLAIVLLIGSTWAIYRYPGPQPWLPSYAEGAAGKPYLRLDEQTLAAQLSVTERAFAALAPQRPELTDLYFVQFAPYARDEVFLRETSAIGALMNQRFDTAQRSLHLVNHASTALTHPWASSANLERAIKTAAQRMDLEQDVLALYLTSHGSKNASLAASHYPLDLTAVTAQMLRKWLDEAGIAHRVIIVSACYSGSFIEPLKTPGTLIMTAASAQNTSFGCGDTEDYTYFAKALFDEQLRTSHDFAAAFKAALPALRARELEQGFEFSDPQIHIGQAIGPVLQQLYRRLAGPQARAAAAPS